MEHANQVILIQLVIHKRRKMTIINVTFAKRRDILRKISQNIGNGSKEKVKIIFLYASNQT